MEILATGHKRNMTLSFRHEFQIHEQTLASGSLATLSTKQNIILCNLLRNTNATEISSVCANAMVLLTRRDCVLACGHFKLCFGIQYKRLIYSSQRL